MKNERPVLERAPRVAVFGGSFNPPHIGHVLTAVYVLSTAPIDHLLVVPVYRHPFAKGLAPFEDRLEMCALAFGWLSGVVVSTVERDLDGESLTLRTLQRLSLDHPDWQMRLVIGSDVLPDLDKWHRFDLVQELAPPLVIPRAGVGGGRILPDVSSTQVRELFARRARPELVELVPARVIDFAERRALYENRSGT
jgi:nicotinate-nucleotide adenylyltransferase